MRTGRLPRLAKADARHASAPHYVGFSAVVVTAVLQLANLAAFPPFIDEAANVRWASRLAESPSLATLWLPLIEDWKTPGLMWATAVLHRCVDDPILAGRLVAAFSGVFTVALVFHIGRRLFGSWPAAVAASIMAVSPASTFTARLALADSPIVMLTALTFALSLAAVRGHLPSALGAGLAAALAFWFKLSGALLLIIPIAGILLASQTTATRRAALLLAGVAPAAAAIVGFVVAPTSAQTLERAQGSVLSLGELAAAPVDQWMNNLTQMTGWALAYLPAAAIVAAIGALAVPFVTRRREDWWLWSVLIFWLAFHLLLGQTLYSRYVLPALVPLALLAARAIWVVGQAFRRADRRRLASTWVVGATFAVLLSLAVPTTLLVVAPARAALSSDDRAQYIEEWPSGYGQTQALQWIADTTAAEPGSAIVLTNHVLGAPRDLAALTFRNRADLGVHVENRIRHPSSGVADDWSSHGVPVYALMNGNQDDAAEFLRLNPEFKLAASFERPGAKTAVSVLEFRPRPSP